MWSRSIFVWAIVNETHPHCRWFLENLHGTKKMVPLSGDHFRWLSQESKASFVVLMVVEVFIFSSSIIKPCAERWYTSYYILFCIAFSCFIILFMSCEGHRSAPGAPHDRHVRHEVPPRRPLGAGARDVAARIAGQTTFPGWGHMLGRGRRPSGSTGNTATTFTPTTIRCSDRWPSGSSSGSAASGRPRCGGIRPHLIVPSFETGLTWAAASYDSIRGRVETRWEIGERRLTLDVWIPVGSSAEVHIPPRALTRSSRAKSLPGRPPG